jgi:hypothetical protein
MDCLGLAGLRHQRDSSASHGNSTNLCPAYGLFTLVGIAGEDDLDAPDLAGPHSETRKKVKGKTGGNHGQHNTLDRHARASSVSDSAFVRRRSELSSTLSASLTAELRHEIEGLRSSDDAALWAQRRLAAKNALSAADAERVEQAFEKKLATFASATADQASVTGDAQQRRRAQSRRRQSHRVDKTVLALPAARRIRDREHVKAVAKQPCLVCGRRPTDAHHLRFAQSRALGRKVSDEFTVPLCRGHHREVHRCGDEAAWWDRTGIDPNAAARVLWLKTHPLPNDIVLQESKLVESRTDAVAGLGRARSVSRPRSSNRTC